MTDEEFWQHHAALMDDVAEATHSYYMFKTIDDFAAENELHLRRINEAASFWIVSRKALYSAFMIAIGRIFDCDKRSFSIHKLQKDVVACPERFSTSALAKRKRNQPDFKEEWLPDILKDAWEPTVAELEHFRDALVPARAKYDEVYGRLRHKTIAHSDMDREGITPFIDKSRMGDIEDILYVLNDLLSCLQHSANNGTRLEPGIRTYDYADRIVATTRQALIRLTGS